MQWKYEHIGNVMKINTEGLRRQWSSLWSNSASKHARDLILVSTRSLDLDELRTHAMEVSSMLGRRVITQLLHEGLHHLLREGDPVVDTHVNIVIIQKETIFQIPVSIKKIQLGQVSA